MKDDSFVRFDMAKEPRKCRWFFSPIMWVYSLLVTKQHRAKIEKINMEGIKPPYILLGNHNAFYDMNVSIRATMPHFPHYVVAIDGYLGREWLLRNIGCICKRKFTQDLILIRHLKSVIKKKGIAAIYPEARYSLCGTESALPESLGRLCKMLDVPVVTLICHGNHINHPFWNTRYERKVAPTEATMRCLFTQEELRKVSADEVNAALVREFKYDDFDWQKEHGIEVTDENRAVGLEKVLYQCPCCGKEFEMATEGKTLFCKACGATWEMNELGELTGKDGGKIPGGYSHIPSWYEWERENVRKEVEAGTYSSGEIPASVESLPNAKAFIALGDGVMCHDMNGFYVKVKDQDGDEHEMRIPAHILYSVHIEYEYLFKHGDCVDLNTLTDTWYTYPHDAKFSVTKMALATEELYYKHRRDIGKPCKPGMA